jgi:hypothetical protein
MVFVFNFYKLVGSVAFEKFQFAEQRIAFDGHPHLLKLRQ